jgi:hypothetical protein
MKEISIIIDGVRYDAVDVESEFKTCKYCDLKYHHCREYELSDLCYVEDHNFIYKLSQKKFER